MRRRKHTTNIFLGCIIFTFFLNIGAIYEKEIVMAEEEPSKEWGIIKKQISKYQEKQMPLNTAEYYNITGIWNTMIDTDGTLFSFAKNDKDHQYRLLSWTNKRQLEKELPLLKTVPKKYKTGYISLLPYSSGKKTGYILYKKKNEKVYSCLIGKKGKFVQEISLQKFIEKGIETEREISFYAILGASKIKKNREAFFININETWDSCYLFDIDIIKNKLVSVKKCAYLPIGADEQYYYGIEVEGNFYFNGAFTNGKLIIEDRKTGEYVNSIEIPNDRIAMGNDTISQEFDIKDGTVWFANRTGVYFLKPENKEWTMVMDSQQSSFLNQEYSLTDITVIDENTFYLLFLIGDDDESASILAKYTTTYFKKKKSNEN